MKNKGYALSAIVYPLLLVCLVLILSILFNLNNKQNVLNNLKDIIKDSGPTSYDAVLETKTYTAQTNTSTYNATGSNYSYTCNKSFTGRTGPFQDGSYNHWCANGHMTNTGSASISGTCQHKISGTNYSCPNGGTLSGTTCTVTSYSCPNGGTLSGTTCTKEEYTCPNGGTLNGTICEL